MSDKSTAIHSSAANKAVPSVAGPPVNIVAFGWSLSTFFVITYVLCIALGLIIPEWEMHKPWLQFFPGFEWLTTQGFLIGLAEAFTYGWFVALVFAPLYNLFSARRGS